MRFLKWFIIGILVITTGILSFLLLYVQSSRPVYHGEVHTTKVAANVKVYFDDFGIPHIYAQTAKDAYFTLGYVHAQERLFQMEMLRRVGGGNLAEVFGSELSEVDAFFRTLGINKAADQSNALFFNNPTEQWQKDALAYMEGINHFIENGNMPPEFALLGIPARPFTTRDFFLITGYMSFSFAEALRTDPILDKISRKLGPEYMKAFGQSYIAGNTKIGNHHDSTLTANSKLSAFTDQVIKKLPVQPWLGSNGWVMSPAKSASGKVLLANDTHIGYQQPAVWYEAHLEYPGFALYGNYLAGFPFPLVGHTRNVAWGLTMFENDDMNLYREKEDPNNKEYYIYKGNKEKYTTRTEVIAIKDKPDSVITIRESIHGPIVNDVLKQLDSTAHEPVALWWAYTKFPGTALQVTYHLAHSKNATDARKAASMVNAPGLNIMFGDAYGNIAWWAAAKLPIYPAGMNTKLILDGTSGQDDILGYYDFDQNPMSENPPEGYVYSANNQPDTIAGILYPGYYAPHDRALRITELLKARNKWSVSDMKSITADVTSMTQPGNAAIILNALSNDPVLTQSAEHKRSAFMLKTWTGNHQLNDIAPTIYYKLISHIFESAMVDELGEEDYNSFVNTHLMKNSYTIFLQDDNSPWWDDIRTKEIKETRKTIFVEAFKSTINELKASSGVMDNWTWGSAHTLEHVHPVGRQAPLDKIFNVGPFQVPGGIETINNAGFHLNTSGKYSVSYGPAMRILIDFNDINNGLSILPTGQSGHMRSPYYQDQSIMYNTNKFRPMLMGKEYIEKTCTNILTFVHR
ncbi:MAG: penicillin acylase family protein [Bacteroidetes bacterium]|nr:penicillin acylase family protein [Bacteroidota bacterium]